MAQVKVEFSGGVVAEPESKELGGVAALQFPVYVNHSRKNKQTGEYEDSGDTTKIRVTLWGDLASTDIRKGDIVEVEGTLVEKEFQKQDGSTGRALQTEFVNSIVLKYRKDGGSPAPQQGFRAPADQYTSAGDGTGGFGGASKGF